MTQFLRLLAEADKAQALRETCARLRQGEADPRHFEVTPESFDAVPGKPFAYWVSEAVQETFKRLLAFEGEGRTVRVGLQTSDDFRFVRAWWEVSNQKWFPFAKGGTYSPFYAGVYLMVNWDKDGEEIAGFTGSVIRNPDYYLRPGLTWPLHARSFAPQAMPSGCIFSVRGYCAFPLPGEEATTLVIFNSSVFDYLFKTGVTRLPRL